MTWITLDYAEGDQHLTSSVTDYSSENFIPRIVDSHVYQDEIKEVVVTELGQIQDARPLCQKPSNQGQIHQKLSNKFLKQV